MNPRKLKVGILLAAAIVLGIALRITLFGIGCSRIPAFDDECKISLQSMQIARGHFPLTILASPYIFPLDAYLMAPFIRFLPRDAFGARIMAFGIGLLTVLLSVLILKRWGSWKDTWPGIVLILFPSGYLLMLQVGCALPGYPTLMLLGTLVVWLAQRHAEAGRRVWLPAFLAGLAGGLAASDTLLSLPFLVMGGAMIAVARGWRTALVSAPVCGFGALIGFLPHLIATHIHSDAFQTVQQSVSLRSAIKRIVDPVLGRTLPSAFGWAPPIFPDHRQRVEWPMGLDLCIGVLLAVLLVVFTVAILWSFIRRWRQERWPRMDISLVFLGISWMCLMLFLFSARSHYHTYRYFIPIVLSFPFLIAHAYRQSGTLARWLLGLMTVLLLAVNVAGSIKIMNRWATAGFADFLKSYDLQPVFSYLDQRGITRCHGTYADAYRITYETDERIVCAQPYNERFAGWEVPFKELVDASTNVAYVLSDTYKFPPAQFEEDLASMKVKCRKETCGHYEVYTDFQSALQSGDKAIPQQLLKAKASHNPADAARMTDGTPGFWRCNGHVQETGMWVSVEWDSPRLVRKVLFDHGPSGRDFTKGLLVHYLRDGRWEAMPDAVKEISEPFEFRNQHPIYVDAANVSRVDIPHPMGTSGLKFEITEPKPRHAWTINEIKIIE